MITALAKDHVPKVKPKPRAPTPPTETDVQKSATSATNHCSTCMKHSYAHENNMDAIDPQSNHHHHAHQGAGSMSPVPPPPCPTSGYGSRPPLIRQQSYFEPSFEEDFQPDTRFDTSYMMARDPYYRDERFPYRQESMFGPKYRQPMGRLPNNGRRDSKAVSKKPSQQQR